MGNSYFIQFKAANGFTHFAKLSHASKSEEQLQQDWAESLEEAKLENGIEWQHLDAVVLMTWKGWTHEELSTVRLDY